MLLRGQLLMVGTVLVNSAMLAVLTTLLFSDSFVWSKLMLMVGSTAWFFGVEMVVTRVLQTYAPEYLLIASKNAEALALAGPEKVQIRTTYGWFKGRAWSWEMSDSFKEVARQYFADNMSAIRKGVPPPEDVKVHQAAFVSREMDESDQKAFWKNVQKACVEFEESVSQRVKELQQQRPVITESAGPIFSDQPRPPLSELLLAAPPTPAPPLPALPLPSAREARKSPRPMISFRGAIVVHRDGRDLKRSFFEVFPSKRVAMEYKGEDEQVVRVLVFSVPPVNRRKRSNGNKQHPADNVDSADPGPPNDEASRG